MKNSRKVQEQERERPQRRDHGIYSKGVVRPGTKEYRDALETEDTRGKGEFASGDEAEEARLRSASRERSPARQVVLKDRDGVYDKFSPHYNNVSGGDDKDPTFLNEPERKTMQRQDLKEEKNAEGEHELHEYFKEVKARSRSQRINRRETVAEYSPTSEERRNGRIDFPRRFQRYEEIEREKERREEERRREQEAEEHRSKGKGKGDKGKGKGDGGALEAKSRPGHILPKGLQEESLEIEEESP